jgi:hypothetical protein
MDTSKKEFRCKWFEHLRLKALDFKSSVYTIPPATKNFSI